jgi:hypothetical protein
MGVREADDKEREARRRPRDDVDTKEGCKPYSAYSAVSRGDHADGNRGGLGLLALIMTNFRYPNALLYIYKPPNISR